VSDAIDQRAEGERGPAPGPVERVRQFLVEDLWHLEGGRRLTAAAVRTLQLAVMIARGFVQDELLLRASALTYVTTLSLMPLLIVTVALIGLVGGQQSIIDLVVGQLTAVSPAAHDMILERLREVRVGSLGTLGGSVLLVTAILTLRHLERTLNGIWGIRQGRSWMRRFSDYLAVLIVAPILTATAVSLATTLQSGTIVAELRDVPTVATLYDSGLRHLPNVLLCVAFTFLYWFFPNTSVRPLSALLGGVVATVLFSAARYAYVDLSLGAARYSMLFGGMVALPLVLAWLYVCWAIVLLGAEVSFAHQNLAHYRRELLGREQGMAEREAVGLRLALEIARAFFSHRPAPTASELSAELDLSVRSTRDVLEALEADQLIVQCGDEERDVAYVPARPLEHVTVSDVLRAIRGERRPVGPASELEEGRAEDAVVARVLDDLALAAGAVGDRRTLADLVTATAEEIETSEEGTGGHGETA
jgi:membrane protein